MVIDYCVKPTGDDSSPTLAVISIGENGEKIGQLSRQSQSSFVLTEFEGGNTKSKYVIDLRVDGEIRPFSALVMKQEDKDQSASISHSSKEPEVVLKIRDRLFTCGGKMYILSNISENRPREHFHGGPKSISRLDNFPYSKLEDVDLETKGRPERRLRGVHVGEISGIGLFGRGHHVRLEDPQLEKVGLPLAATSFVINTTWKSHRVPTVST